MAVIQHDFFLSRLNYDLEFLGGNVIGIADQLHIGVAKAGNVKGRDLARAVPRKEVVGNVRHLTGAIIKIWTAVSAR